MVTIYYTIWYKLDQSHWFFCMCNPNFNPLPPQPQRYTQQNGCLESLGWLWLPWLHNSWEHEPIGTRLFAAFMLVVSIFLFREIQMHQMKNGPPSSPWVANSSLLTSLTESSFSLPLFVVVCVALLLLLCRQRRPQRHSLSRTSSYLSLSRTASYVTLSRNTSTARLGSIISSS